MDTLNDTGHVDHRRLFMAQNDTGPWACYFCPELVVEYGGIGGRNLVVHHLDGDHANNDPANLASAHWDCHASHHARIGSVLRRRMDPADYAGPGWYRLDMPPRKPVKRITVSVPGDLFDVPEPTRRRGPRWKGKTVVLPVRMDEGTKDHVDRLAKLQGVSLAEWVRQAIEFRIATQYAELKKRGTPEKSTNRGPAKKDT